MSNLREKTLNQALDERAAAKKEEWGSSELSRAEWKALRGLYLSLRDQIFEKDHELTASDRAMLSEEVRGSIVDDGWPALKDLTQDDLAETAMSHACTVAEKLFHERGEEATPNTIWSYTTKNQSDRHFATMLRRAGKFQPGSLLREEWERPGIRHLLQVKVPTHTPKGLDPRFVYGIAKVERYWPAQLLRNLEAVRLGKATPEEIDRMNIRDISKETFKIPWNNFSQEVETAEHVQDITVGVAIKTMSMLASRGLSSRQNAAVILAGYSPGGSTRENGRMPEIQQIWGKILNKVWETPGLSSVAMPLERGITEQLQELGYPGF